MTDDLTRAHDDGCVGDHLPGLNPDCINRPAGAVLAGEVDPVVGRRLAAVPDDGVTGHTVDLDPTGEPSSTHAPDDPPRHGCPACAEASTGTAAFVPLPPELTEGLTTWGIYGGAQIRIEANFARLDDGTIATDDTGNPVLEAPTGPTGVLYLAFRDDAVRSTENGEPYRLTTTEARALRDLLNIATARGAL